MYNLDVIVSVTVTAGHGSCEESFSSLASFDPLKSICLDLFGCLLAVARTTHGLQVLRPWKCIWEEKGTWPSQMRFRSPKNAFKFMTCIAQKTWRTGPGGTATLTSSRLYIIRPHKLRRGIQKHVKTRCAGIESHMAAMQFIVHVAWQTHLRLLSSTSITQLRTKTENNCRAKKARWANAVEKHTNTQRTRTERERERENVCFDVACMNY